MPQREISPALDKMGTEILRTIDGDSKHVEHHQTDDRNLHYDIVDEEPEIHWRTWVALASMFSLSTVQLFALNGPPTVLSYIGTSLQATPSQTWIPNSLSLVQAVVSPLISSASDTFQARKSILVGTAVLAMIGAAIAPGSKEIGRLLAAQVLIGFGFSSAPLAYVVPSEILPRKWRPVAQGMVNVGAAIGSISAPLVIGAFTQADHSDGWRSYYWVQLGFWAFTAGGVFFGYTPPRRHTRLDHLSFVQKLATQDILGITLLTIGLALLLVALNLGGGIYTWTDTHVLSTLVVGIVMLVAFCVYEWRGTSTGFLNHELFRGGKNAGRTFALCVVLIFIEGIIGFSFAIFYPTLTLELYEQEPFKLALRLLPYWIAVMCTTVVWAFWSTRFRTIRVPLFFGFLILAGGSAGLATLQPSDSLNSIVFAVVSGIGFAAPLILIVAGVQLSTPHHLIATATAVTASTRAVAASVFTAIYAASLTNGMNKKLPEYVAMAALQAGLPPSELDPFVGAFLSNNTVVLTKLSNLSPPVLGAAAVAAKQAFADSVRVIYVIPAPFAILACIICFFFGDLTKTMNYSVDAPVEELHAKHQEVTSQGEPKSPRKV